MNIKYIMHHFKNDWQHFGLLMAFDLVIRPFFNKRRKEEFICAQKSKYLKKLLSHILKAHQHDEVPITAIDDTAKIYVCWLQGEKQMPRIVKSCYQSILEHANGREVVLLTLDNYKEYIEIPDFVEEKVLNQMHLYFFFADIIRNALLYQKGGIWVDATIYLTEDLSIESLPFYTQKRDLSPDNTCRYISRQRWVTWFYAGVKGNPLHRFVYESLIAYISAKDCILDYFLVDYILALGYDHIAAIKKMIDDVPLQHKHPYALFGNLSKDYRSEDIRQLLATNSVHKLSYKKLEKNYSESSVFNAIINHQL